MKKLHATENFRKPKDLERHQYFKTLLTQVKKSLEPLERCWDALPLKADSNLGTGPGKLHSSSRPSIYPTQSNHNFDLAATATPQGFSFVFIDSSVYSFSVTVTIKRPLGLKGLTGPIIKSKEISVSLQGKCVL